MKVSLQDFTQKLIGQGENALIVQMLHMTASSSRPLHLQCSFFGMAFAFLIY